MSYDYSLYSLKKKSDVGGPIELLWIEIITK